MKGANYTVEEKDTQVQIAIYYLLEHPFQMKNLGSECQQDLGAPVRVIMGQQEYLPTTLRCW